MFSSVGEINKVGDVMCVFSSVFVHVGDGSGSKVGVEVGLGAADSMFLPHPDNGKSIRTTAQRYAIFGKI